MNSLSITEQDVIQPWGLLDVGFRNNAANMDPPGDWRAPDGAGLPRSAHFNQWFDRTLALVNKILWPRYDASGHQWIGDSVQIMRQLTEADLKVMLSIQTGADGVKRFDQQIDGPLRSSDWKTHRELFQSEDEMRGGNAYRGSRIYDRTLDDTTVDLMSHLCFQAGDRKMSAAVNARMKGQLQRPRPMHQALLMNFSELSYEEAGSSVSPSMCSGHCLQGVSYVAAAVERLLSDGGAPGATPQALSAWGVEIGDRRVLAGVHYPSDNLCSWIMFLSGAQFVFRSCEPVKYMAEAIHNSYVLGQIRSSGFQVYERVLKELDQLLKNAHANC